MTSLRESLRSRWHLLLTALVCAGLVLVAPGAAHARQQTRDASCFGAAALDPGASCPSGTTYLGPGPEKAAQDYSAAYDVRANNEDCWSNRPLFPLTRCHFGARHGKVKVVLAGNSHAGQWLPALQRIAKRRHWRITTELASQCVLAVVTQMFPDEAARGRCRSWSRHTAVRIRHEHPDLIVFANRMSLPAYGHTLATSVRTYARGIARVFRQWRGIPVVLLRDTPAPGQAGISVPACLMGHPDDHAACNGTRGTWMSPDPGVLAAKRFANVRKVNLNDHICRRRVCQAVVGGVIPYFDGSHLTATYARTLTPYLEPPLRKALRRHR